MLRSCGLLIAVSIGAAICQAVPQSFAAVVVLDGSESPSGSSTSNSPSDSPPNSPSNSPSNGSDKPASAGLSPHSSSEPSSNSNLPGKNDVLNQDGLLSPSPPSPIPNKQEGSPRTSPSSPSSQSPPPTGIPDDHGSTPTLGAATPTSPAPAIDPRQLAASNPAELALEMLPGTVVNVGSIVSFKVTTKKAGYVVLFDVDPTGHLTQIYPNTASLTRTSRANGNYVKAGGKLTIPLAGDPYAGIKYVVSPPSGRAMIVGILSTLPVQFLDLPDVPFEMTDQPNLVLSYLLKQTNKLRIPDSDNHLREDRWSFDAKSYTIQ